MFREAEGNADKQPVIMLFQALAFQFEQHEKSSDAETQVSLPPPGLIHSPPSLPWGYSGVLRLQGTVTPHMFVCGCCCPDPGQSGSPEQGSGSLFLAGTVESLPKSYYYSERLGKLPKPTSTSPDLGWIARPSNSGVRDIHSHEIIWAAPAKKLQLGLEIHQQQAHAVSRSFLVAHRQCYNYPNGLWQKEACPPLH